MSINLSSVRFEKILNKRSGCGLIWEGIFHSLPCVIKMVMLTSGIHYDKDNRQYLNGMHEDSDNLDKSKSFVCTSENSASHLHSFLRYQTNLEYNSQKKINASITGNETQQIHCDDYSLFFEKNDINPFKHAEFKHRRAVSLPDFLREISEMTHLGLLGLAPKVHGYCFSNMSSAIHYGFIIMEKVDGSLKDILYQRELTEIEKKLVEDTINHLHLSYESVHGDLQPSNIGIYLNTDGKICKVCFFDCQKIKHKEGLSSHKFQKLILKDWKIYHKYTNCIRNKLAT